MQGETQISTVNTHSMNQGIVNMLDDLYTIITDWKLRLLDIEEIYVTIDKEKQFARVVVKVHNPRNFICSQSMRLIKTATHIEVDSKRGTILLILEPR